MPLRRADDIVEGLLARRPEKRIVEKTTGLPYGWGLWLRALSPLPRPFPSVGIIAELIQRPLPGLPGRLPALSTLQALRRLAWQGWDPAPRDQRWMRWSSAALSVLLHVMFAVLLLWVAVIRPPAAPPEEGGESGRIQVTLVGEGTPPVEAGAQPPAAETAPEPPPELPAPAAEAAPSAAAASVPPPPAPTPDPAETPPAPPSPAAPVVEPPLQATVVPEATTDFVVPPVTLPRTEVRVLPRQPQDITVQERTVATVQAPASPTAVPAPRVADVPLRTPQVTVRERDIPVVQAPAPTLALPGPQIEVAVTPRELQVRERAVQPVVAPPVAVSTVPPREVSVRPPSPAPAVTVRERSVPNATTAPAPASPPAPRAPAQSPTASTAPAPTATTPSPAPAAQPAPDPGNWATQRRGDDWAAANHAQDADLNGRAVSATGRSGDSLFNADGSARVVGQDGKGSSPRGAPGGDNDGWTKERIAQSGTWLKRPPYDYTPTSLDKYWAPNQSLLAEWVRKGIKSVEIPIPGSTATISCVVSLLQFGGGCGLTDPNMQDQPAVARPPPDIPFKPELQEDNGSR